MDTNTNKDKSDMENIVNGSLDEDVKGTEDESPAEVEIETKNNKPTNELVMSELKKNLGDVKEKSSIDLLNEKNLLEEKTNLDESKIEEILEQGINTEIEEKEVKESINTKLNYLPSEYVDYSQPATWQCTTEQLMHTLSQPEISAAKQIEICFMLKYHSLGDSIPFLVDIMLNLHSDAIYSLLLYKGRSMRIRVMLFCYLKSILSNVEDVNKAAMCYYLCCDLYEIEIYNDRRNTKILGIRINNPRMRNIVFRTRSFLSQPNKLPTFVGMIVSFLRAASFPFKMSFNDINRKSSVFLKKRNLRNITTKSNLYFKHNLKYYYDLVKISDKLSELGNKSMRQRLLFVLLEMFNKNTSINIINGTLISSMHVTSCLSLDSRENGPFMVNLIQRSKTQVLKDKIKIDKELHNKVKTLLYQFDTVKQLDDINDLNGIRNNILVAIEQLILEKIISEERRRLEESTVDFEVLSKVEEVKDESDLKTRIQKYFNGFDSVYRNRSISIKPTHLSLLQINNISSFIVKNGSVMKEEYYAFRTISQIKNIFIQHRVPLYLKNYKIVIITEDSGLVETVANSTSIHKIKERYNTLAQYYDETYADVKEAKKNFLLSCVGYSLVQYILSLKDRHNANILIDEYGHMVHIDFGFILGKHPGFYGVESAPFKFSIEYLELVNMDEFKALFIEGFKCLYNNRNVLPVEIQSKLVLNGVSVENFCDGLISRSVGNYLTVLYDQFQYYSNGYYK